MSDQEISQLQINGTTYNIADATARDSVSSAQSWINRLTEVRAIEPTSVTTSGNVHLMGDPAIWQIGPIVSIWGRASFAAASTVNTWVTIAAGLPKNIEPNRLSMRFPSTDNSTNGLKSSFYMRVTDAGEFQLDPTTGWSIAVTPYVDYMYLTDEF